MHVPCSLGNHGDDIVLPPLHITVCIFDIQLCVEEGPQCSMLLTLGGGSLSVWTRGYDHISGSPYTICHFSVPRNQLHTRLTTKMRNEVS